MTVWRIVKQGGSKQHADIVKFRVGEYDGEIGTKNLQ